MEQASNQYLRSAVLTASPEQLHLMLYDGAIRFTRQGLQGIETQNCEQAYHGFSRAQKIVLELLNSLNYDVDRVLCTRMAGLYNFLYRQLVIASTRRDEKAASEALRLLEYQRETWLMLIEKLKEQGTASAEDKGRSQPEQPVLAEAGYGTLSVEG